MVIERERAIPVDGQSEQDRADCGAYCPRQRGHRHCEAVQLSATRGLCRIVDCQREGKVKLATPHDEERGVGATGRGGGEGGKNGRAFEK